MERDEHLRILESKLAIAKSIVVLKASPGWKEFRAHLGAFQADHLRKLLDRESTQRDYQAGYCSGLALVVNLMDNVESELVKLERSAQANGPVQRDPLGGVR